MLSTYTDRASKTPGLGHPAHGVGSHRLTLRSNFLWTLVGNVVYATCQWGILVALAKMGTPQTVGEFALALAITGPIVIGAGLSLRGVQATDTGSEYCFGDYLMLRLLTTGAAGLAIVGVVGFSHYSRHTAAVITVVGLAKGFEAISDIFYGLLQQHERMDRIALSMMIKGVVSLTVVVSVICLSGDLLTGVCGMAATWALILVFYDVRSGAKVLRSSQSYAEGPMAAGSHPNLVHHLKLRCKPRILARLALLALPVGVVMAIAPLNANIPRYFIEYHLGTRELGIFAALAYPMTAGVTVVAALGQSAAPRLARHYASGDYRGYSTLVRKLLCLGLATGAGGVILILLAGRPILALLYLPEYTKYVGTFLWLGVAAGIGYTASLLGYGMTAARYLRAQVPVVLSVMLVMAVGCAVLVPRHQLVGAAVAMLLASTCQALGGAAVIAYALRNRGAK